MPSGRVTERIATGSGPHSGLVARARQTLVDADRSIVRSSGWVIWDPYPEEEKEDLPPPRGTHGLAYLCKNG